MSRAEAGLSISHARPTRRYTMLARTADNLYWLARYMERADFLARTIEATQRLTALPSVDTEAGPNG